MPGLTWFCDRDRIDRHRLLLVTLMAMVGSELRRRAAACLIGAGMIAMLAAAPALADDFEPNDSQDVAAKLQSGRSYVADIGRLDDAVNQRPGDVDWYSLNAAAGPVDVAYTALQDEGSCFGPELRLLDGAGDTLGTAQPAKGNTDHIRYDAAADGVLYLRVQQYQIDSCAAPIRYRVRAEFTEASGGPGIAGLEVKAKKSQKQHGKRIRVKVEVGAAEPIDATATGRVKAGGRRIKLRGDAAAISAGDDAKLTLTAKGRAARRIAAALDDRKKVVATVDLTATDGDGDERTKRLVADAPLGAFLSGGVDSAMVVSQMAELTSGPVRAFTIGFSDERYDERSGARRIAER